MDILYVAKSLTQDWNHDITEHGDEQLPAGTAQAIREIARRIFRGRYALVHLAGWGHPVLLAALGICRAARVPAVVETDTAARSRGIAWRERTKSLVYPLLFRMPAMFLPGGTSQARYLADYGVGAQRMRLAQMTVDVDQLIEFKGENRAARQDVRRRLGVPDDHTLFLFVGRLEPVKGIMELLDSFTILCRRRSDVTLAIIGDGSLRDEITRRTTGMKLPVHRLGRKAGADLWECYVAADTAVVPSLSDSWGLVVNEAMAFGLPVIATDAVGCAADLLAHQRNALIVPAGDIAALAAAMDRVAESESIRAAMGEESATKISTWTLANEAGNVSATWREVLAR